MEIGTVLVDEEFRHFAGYRTSNAGHFEAVRQSVMNEFGTWQRKNLCLVLQTMEDVGENYTVVISLKLVSDVGDALCPSLTLC